jgi:HPt (histidine-containing phosphotransfer) domain-containing protein
MREVHMASDDVRPTERARLGTTRVIRMPAMDLVDRARLKQLESLVAKERVLTLIKNSIADAERTCDVMARLPAGSDELVRQAHNLSGTSGLLGLRRISRVSLNIEDRTRKGIRVEALVAELREVVTATTRELRALGLM